MMIFGIVFKKGRKKKFQILPPLHFAKKKKEKNFDDYFSFPPNLSRFFFGSQKLIYFFLLPP